MAKKNQFLIPAHRSIYNNLNRELKINYFEPQLGINKETGIMLIIPGFGIEDIDSPVYEEYNRILSDKYNLVTVQCNYFGSKFMGITTSFAEFAKIDFNINHEEIKRVFTKNEVDEIYSNNVCDINKLLKFGSNHDITIDCSIKLFETLGDFCDFGIMQAIDNLYALLHTIKLINKNSNSFSPSKVFAYGESHGAFLCYLCNAFAPTLFSLIIDNSSWKIPGYLKNMDRVITYNIGKLILKATYVYMAKSFEFDSELYNLASLYKTFENKCDIISFHGISDFYSSNAESEQFSKSIDKFKHISISHDKVDMDVFHNTDHCFDTNVVKLFDYVMKTNTFDFSNRLEFILPDIKIETSKYTYALDYSTGFPIVDRKFKQT